MEEFIITRHGMEISQEGMAIPGGEEGFHFFVVDSNPWEQVPSLLSDDKDNNNLADWIEHLRTREAEESKRRSKEGSIIFRPHFDRMGKETHYICLRDIDKQGVEHPIRIFLAPRVFVLLEWNSMSYERLQEWFQQGILAKPLELASAMGLSVVRHHQKQLDILEDQMDILEEEILTAPRTWQLKRIITLHRRILGLKRSLNAHSNVFERFKNIEKAMYGELQEELLFDIRRAQDHVHQTHEMIESLREAYQAAIDNRANDIMKLLTLLATILLPITLLTSFFGMNFQEMPLIHTPFGIWVFYGLSVLIIIIVIAFFRKKKWLD
ncbi:MAG: magnesium transporter CorA family protein [Desulfitobacterium sp.]